MSLAEGECKGDLRNGEGGSRVIPISPRSKGFNDAEMALCINPFLCVLYLPKNNFGDKSLAFYLFDPLI